MYVSNLFTITENNNTVIATAKDTSAAGFYGHTYNLVIEASIIDSNTDISKYCDKDGKATIPNTGTITVDGNAFPSNTVNFTYQTKSNSVNKYIINQNGEKSKEAQLYNNTVTYTGKAVIKDSEAVKSIVLSDTLDSNLKYKALNIMLDDSDITDWGTSSYDEDSNTVSFAFSKDKFSSVTGKAVEYALTCDYIGEYSNESKNLSNIIDFTVNEETAKSNDTELKIPVDSYVTKYIYDGDKLVNEYTLPTDRKDNIINYGGSILISEKEPVNNFEFTDKLDSNLEFVSISFLNGSKELKCKAEYDNGVVKATLSDDLNELQGKVIQWKLTCRYVGDDKPTKKITIPNTANIKVNDESYQSNVVKAFVPMVTDNKPNTSKDNTSKDNSCGTPYRRVTWTRNGSKKIVWRCTSRLNYGTKYCKTSPSIEESVLQNAIAEAITQKAKEEGADISRIKQHIQVYQSKQDNSSVLAKQEKLRELEQSIKDLSNMDSEAAQNGDFDEQFEILFKEKYALEDELSEINKNKSKLETNSDTLEEMSSIMKGLKNHPVEYNDIMVRHLIECIKVMSPELLHIYFKDGTMINISII